MKKYFIAIVGATGLVGRKVLEIISQRHLNYNNFVLFASKRSVGKTINIGDKPHKVKLLSCENLDKYNFDYAIFCTGEDVSKQYVNYLATKNTVVIDFSSAFRKNYPLIVPEINFDQIKDSKIICNPNCSTIAGVMALCNINKNFGLKRIVYSTYQAVSGAGWQGLADLKNKTANKLPYCIHNNLIPFIGNVSKNGYSKEELKMIFETKKILALSRCKITATCVRVPIDVGHSLSINFQTEQRATTGQIKKVLQTMPGLKLVDYPMPMLAKNQDDVLVGRLRKDECGLKSFNMFVSSDNLRKGAAQNGVQILERLINERSI